MLIVFGGINVYASNNISKKQAQQEILDELSQIQKRREKYKMVFTKSYYDGILQSNKLLRDKLMKRKRNDAKNEMKNLVNDLKNKMKHLVSDEKFCNEIDNLFAENKIDTIFADDTICFLSHQSTISKYQGVIILSRLMSITEYISQQYQSYNVHILDASMQQLLHIPTELLSSLSDKVAWHGDKEFSASSVNTAIDNMINILSKMKNIVEKNLPNFALELGKIIDFLPVFYNISEFIQYL